jgi:hypothetical protein
MFISQSSRLAWYNLSNYIIIWKRFIEATTQPELKNNFTRILMQTCLSTTPLNLCGYESD